MESEENSTAAQAKRAQNEPKTYTNRRGIRRKTSSSLLTPPSPSKSPRSREKPALPTAVILDNGVYTAKLGLSTDESPHVLPNCIMKVKSERKRFFIGNQIDDCRDMSGLYYMLASEKGYITKWNIQKPVWDYMFSSICPLEDRPLIMTQPLLNFKAIQEITDEIFFEEYEVKSMLRVNPSDLVKYQYTNNVALNHKTPCIVVDSGFSFTHIIPYVNGKKDYKGTIRLNIGGKVLTNHLKDIISYRQLHVMDETYVINQVKEDSCYVSLNFKEDMRIAGSHGKENNIVRNYVLPDFNSIRRGYLQGSSGERSEITEGCQILRLNNERFTVPEMLFHPSDIGMESMGIAETIVESIKRCPIKNQPALAKNIVLVGGNANFPGYRERIFTEVRSYLPDHWDVNVYKPDNPVTFAWEGGKSLAQDPKIKSLLITKEQYEETGSTFTYDRFSDWVHFKKTTDESNKSKEISLTEGASNSCQFSRFELFGKYESDSTNETPNEEISSVKTENKSNLDIKESKDKRLEADTPQEDNGNSKVHEKSTKAKPVANEPIEQDYSELIQSDDSNSDFELPGHQFSYI